MDRRLVTVSKFLSKHLRHCPEDLGLVLETGGWVRVDDLIAACTKPNFAIDYDELVECVETNDKQRFSFDVTGDLIRANQGHSTPVDLQLAPVTPPDILWHGTVDRFLDAILKLGLIKGKRHHVHLTHDVETAKKVGARRGKPVILRVDAAAMRQARLEFFQSANGVWLTDNVPPEFLARP